MTLEIVELGVATTVQDAGRPGLAHVGVPCSGAVDRDLLALVNRAVGNAPDAAGIETAGGLVVRAARPVLVATSQHDAPIALRPGQTLGLRADGRRQWHYLAVRGGVAGPPVLGSRSHDTLSRLGPPALVSGALVEVGPEFAGPVAEVVAVRPPAERARISPGPRVDWFADGVIDVMLGSAWTITASSRVGVRLTGPALARTVEHELASEGLVRGAIQVPPDGDPIMMLADHPTTGGYPVIAVVDPADVAVVAQRPAGTRVAFSR
jgi:biotin-dependent carboxylase-like uncharacterized protein